MIRQIRQNSLSISALSILKTIFHPNFSQFEKRYRGDESSRRQHFSYVSRMDQSLQQQSSRESPEIEVPIIETEKEKTHKCNQCDYVSSYASNLRTHLKRHTGEKSNKCSLCDYASSNASSLSTHLKTHCGEKSHKCNQCDSTFSQSNYLRKHLKTHRVEKSNKCNQCDFASSHKDKDTFEDTQWRETKEMQPM